MRRSPSNLGLAPVTDKVRSVIPRAWLERGQILALKAMCAVSRLAFVVGRNALATNNTSATWPRHPFVLIKFQFLLIALGDFILRLQEQRFALAQRIFEIEHLLLQGKDLPVVGEKVVLGFEKLVVELRDCRSHLVEVAQANRRLAKLSRCGDRAVGSRDE